MVNDDAGGAEEPVEEEPTEAADLEGPRRAATLAERDWKRLNSYLSEYMGYQYEI